MVSPRRIWMLWLAACLALGIAGSSAPHSSLGLQVPWVPIAAAAAQADLGRVAFLRGGDIWVKDLPDGEERQLTQDGDNRAPRWSPSGQWLAFLKQTADADRPSLWTIGASGAGGQQVATIDVGVEAQMDWSPTADVLAYLSNGGLHVIRPTGMLDLQLIPPDAGVQDFAWRPDGQRIAFASTRAMSGASPQERTTTIQAVSAGGGVVTQILTTGPPAASGVILAGWSPDGANILYWEHPQFSSSLLADGVPLMAVTATGRQSWRMLPAMLARRDLLAWSPDGVLLAAAAGSGRATWTDKTVVVATVRGATRSLSPIGQAALSPAWSPDGAVIAYSAGPDAQGISGGEAAGGAVSQRQIWLARADGSAARPLTPDTPRERAERPRWSTDGRSILYIRTLDDGQAAQLALIDVDGSLVRGLVDGLSGRDGVADFYGYASWSDLLDWWQLPTSVPARTPTPARP